MNRPQTVFELWLWALRESESSKSTPPWQLHTRAFPPESHPDKRGPRDDFRGPKVPGRRLSQTRNQIIGGPPYTRDFERYLESALPQAPIHRALRKMRAPGANRPQSMEFRVCWAIVEGRYPDTAILAWVLRAKEELIRGAALRGLNALWDFTQLELADETVSLDESSTIRSSKTGKNARPNHGTAA